MHRALTINEFHDLLTSKPAKKDSALLTALRKLMSIEEPKDVLVLAEKDAPVWTNWSVV
jgi:hypothetical protein